MCNGQRSSCRGFRSSPTGIAPHAMQRERSTKAERIRAVTSPGPSVRQPGCTIGEAAPQNGTGTKLKLKRSASPVLSPTLSPSVNLMRSQSQQERKRRNHAQRTRSEREVGDAAQPARQLDKPLSSKSDNFQCWLGAHARMRLPASPTSLRGLMQKFSK